MSHPNCTIPQFILSKIPATFVHRGSVFNRQCLTLFLYNIIKTFKLTVIRFYSSCYVWDSNFDLQFVYSFCIYLTSWLLAGCDRRSIIRSEVQLIWIQSFPSRSPTVQRLKNSRLLFYRPTIRRKKRVHSFPSNETPTVLSRIWYWVAESLS